MSSVPGQEYLNPRLSIARARPSGSQLESGRKVAGPHTPTPRSLSGIYGSAAASSFRSDEEHIVLEFGSRFLRAGFAGESKPRCTRGFGPEEQRRVGDFRRWMPGYETVRRKRKLGQDWGEEHELWRMDLRTADIGLVEDKIERAVREVVAQYLLLDHRPRRATVAIPPLLPRPLLSALLSSVFTTLQALSITVLSAPVLDVVSAGLRSALVIDLGWAETAVTAVYEYREIHHRSSVRAGKYLTEEVAAILNEECKKARKDKTPETPDEVSFEEAEEVLMRMGWCWTREEAQMQRLLQGQDSPSPQVSVPISAASPPITIHLPFSRFAEPIESGLFANGASIHDIDDHDLPIPLLAYNALLSLPIDARKLCMSRILITGGISKLPGVKRRILSELTHLIQQRSWDPVRSYGSATPKHELRMRYQQHARTHTADTLGPLPLQLGSPITFRTKRTTDPEPRRGDDNDDEEGNSPDAATPSTATASGAQTPIPASARPQETDPITTKLRELATKHAKPSPEGAVRSVETLGAWSGASIVANLRIKGIVEVDKERFMQHGLAGATKDSAHSVVEQKRQSSLGAGGGRAGDRGSWTLGVWA